jgi:hypothetical protein
MALLKNTFQTDEVEDSSYEPVPAGDYTMRITKSEIKTTKAGNGEYISLQMEILDEGAYHGRVIYDNLNIVNPNEMAVKIARATLKQICEAVGVKELEDTNELHGTPFIGRVKINPAKGDYDASNGVAKYLPLDSASGSGGDPWNN